MRGLVICQFAVTSKNMITKIQKVAEESEDVYVQCESVQNVTTFDYSSFDVVLVAPQVRNYLKIVQDLCAPLGIPVEPIDVVAYGLGDAKKVLDQMRKLSEKKGEKQNDE
ncbi:MAG: hypothetical protein IJF87_09555 [Erysipelotrichaceae bacterium]|nr:hypothetical protein [Erysipelotrichaceae bacterium]